MLPNNSGFARDHRSIRVCRSHYEKFKRAFDGDELKIDDLSIELEVLVPTFVVKDMSTSNLTQPHSRFLFPFFLRKSCFAAIKEKKSEQFVEL